MELIEFKNNETSVSAEVFLAFQKNIANAINRKPILQTEAIRKYVNVKTDWEITKIPLDSISFKRDSENLLIFSSGSIKIGKNIQTVRLTAFCSGISNNIPGDKMLILQKNGETVSSSYQSAIQGGFASASLPNVILDVVEGDEISLALASGKAGNVEILSSYLNIEVIKEILENVKKN